MPRLRVVPRILVMSLALAVSACGYQWVGRGMAASGSEPPVRVAIRTLENDTFEPGVELIVSDALRREVLSRGELRLVSTAGEADWIVEGAVARLRSSSNTFSSVVLALEYSLTLSLELRAEGPKRSLELGKELLEESELYLASADVEASRKNRQEAIRRLADQLAARFHDVLSLELEEPGS